MMVRGEGSNLEQFLERAGHSQNGEQLRSPEEEARGERNFDDQVSEVRSQIGDHPAERRLQFLRPEVLDDVEKRNHLRPKAQVAKARLPAVAVGAEIDCFRALALQPLNRK